MAKQSQSEVIETVEVEGATIPGYATVLRGNSPQGYIWQSGNKWGAERLSKEVMRKAAPKEDAIAWVLA